MGGVILDIQKMISRYMDWLRSETTFEKIGEYYEITTPYLDNANDYLQIYVDKLGTRYISPTMDTPYKA